MLQRIKLLLNKDLTKVFSLNAIATLTKMLTGFISVKVVAALIGPPGIALLGQLNNFSSIFLALSTGGINNGVTKYIAENAGSQGKINIYLRTALWITIILSGICALILISGAGYFARVILKDQQYKSVIFVFGLTIVLYALNTLALSIINGYKQFKVYVKINISGSFIGLLFAVALAYFYGIYGALLAAVTYQSIVFIATVIICSGSIWFSKRNLVGRFSLAAGKKLGHFSIMTLVSAATVPVGQLLIRGYLVSHASLIDAGIWEGMNRISGMYLMIITSSLSVYYLPRLAELKSDREIRSEIISVYKFILPLLFAAAVGIYLFRHLIISVLFNDAFSGMEQYFVYQLAGDFFKIGSWLLAYQMLAKSLTKMYIVTEILSCIVFISLALLCIRYFGAIGASIAYAGSYLLYWIVMILAFKKILFKK